MEFTFQLSNYNSNSLNEQLSRALEKQTELLSRNKLPRLWKGIDKLNSSKTKESVPKKQNFRYKIYGIVLLLLGILLLIPALMKPSELIVPMLTGTFCVGLGIMYLSTPRKTISKKFSRAATDLLNKLKSINQSEQDNFQVRFTLEGMTLMHEDIISYDCFDRIIETRDIFLLIWNERVTVLQKKDLISGTQKDFVSFLGKHTGLEPISLL